MTPLLASFSILLSKLADGGAGHGALWRAEKMIFDECLWTTQPAGKPLDRLPLGSPKGVSLAGAGELLLDALSTEATLSCSSTVEFPKKSSIEKTLFFIRDEYSYQYDSSS